MGCRRRPEGLDSRIGTIPKKQGIRGLSFSSDTRFLAASGWGRVLVIGVSSGKVVQKIPFKGLAVAAFSHSGAVLATAGNRGKGGNKIELWEISKSSKP